MRRCQIKNQIHAFFLTLPRSSVTCILIHGVDQHHQQKVHNQVSHCLYIHPVKKCQRYKKKDTKELNRKKVKEKWQLRIGRLTTRRRVRHITTIFVRMKVHGTIFFLNSFSKARAEKSPSYAQGQTSRVDDGARFGGSEW